MDDSTAPPQYVGVSISLNPDGHGQAPAFKIMGLGWTYKWMPPVSTVNLTLCPECATTHLGGLRPIIVRALHLEREAEAK